MGTQSKKSKTSPKIAPALLMMCQPIAAQAGVNLKDASFHQTFTDDLSAIAHQPAFALDRTYESRSLFNGLLGFGWCTNIEVALSTIGERVIELDDCGRRTEYRIRFPIENGERVYLSPARSEDRILHKDGIFIRHPGDGTEQRFDHRGRLIYISNPEGRAIELTYNLEGVVDLARDNKGRVFKFHYDKASKKLKQIETAKGRSLSFDHLGDDLVLVTNNRGETYRLYYDSLHNLEKVEYPDGSSDRIAYDQDRDWVKKVETKDNCVENYAYTQPEFVADTIHTKSKMTKDCGSAHLMDLTQEFWHQKNADGTANLARVRTTLNDEVTDITFHPQLGVPTSIERSGHKTEFILDRRSRKVANTKDVQQPDVTARPTKKIRD